MDVVYDGIRFTPAEIVERAKAGVHCVGLSILSGSHVALTEEVLTALRAAGLGRVPVVVGGIIPARRRRAIAGRRSCRGLYAQGFRDQRHPRRDRRRGRGPARPGDAPRAILRREAEPRPAARQTMVCPPLAESVDPVMKPASSAARNTTQRAISSGWPRRRTGICGKIDFSSTSLGTAITISVAI